MKTLSSVILVLAVAASPAFADSAYFLKSSAPKQPVAKVTTAAAVPVRPIRTDRVSTHFLRMHPTSVRSQVVKPAVRPNRLFFRGAGQAAIVR